MNISKNTNNSSNKTDNQKPNPELEFALTILKFYIQLIEKFGIWGIDFVAARLSLSPPGKSLSKMSFTEMAQHFRALGQKLLDPTVRNEIIQIIKNSQPIMQEAMQSIIDVVMSSSGFAINDGIAVLCGTPIGAPFCAGLKLVGNAEKLGNDLIKDTGKAVDVAKKAEQESKEVSNVLNTNPNALRRSGGGHSDSDIHSMIHQKQKIKNRINDSISRFLYTKSNMKIDKKKKTKKRYIK